MRFVVDDGGRSLSRFTGKADASDCVVRAIAIATEKPYEDVYDGIATLSKQMGGKRSARDGVADKVWKRYMRDIGWVWTPTMGIGTGCQVHLRIGELPDGPLVCALSKHVCAVVNQVIHDWPIDPSRDGTRCVYGYWQPGNS